MLKRMGPRPGECREEGAFTMTEHVEKNLSVKESLETELSASCPRCLAAASPSQDEADDSS